MLIYGKMLMPRPLIAIADAKKGNHMVYIIFLGIFE